MTQWPVYDDEQIAEVVSVLKSGKVNAWTGGKVSEFERTYAEMVGRRHAIAVCNGTVALELALHALDIGPGDEVIVTPRSFVASASSVVMAGAVPVFADVDRDSQNLTAETIRAVVTPRTRAVIVVHLAGWPADMEPIMRLANDRKLSVIEDCAQAHGALYRGRPIGSFGHVAAFSFCQDKIITTGGEGGMLMMDDDTVWSRAWSRKDHGKAFDTVFKTRHPPGFRWLHESFGSNYRMTEMQAAIGLRQLQRLPEWTTVRTRNAQILAQACAGQPALRTPLPGPTLGHAWYRFYTFVRPDRLRPGWDRDRILNTLNAMDVACFSGSCSEIYLEKAFTGAGIGPQKRLPAARELGETSMAFLVDPAQGEDDMRRAAGALAKVLARATSSRPADGVSDERLHEKDQASVPAGE